MAFPIEVGSLGGIFSFGLGKFVSKLIFALGIGVVTYNATDQLVARLEAYIADLLGASEPIYLQAWTIFGGPTALSIIITAITTRAALAGASKIVGGRRASE